MSWLDDIANFFAQNLKKNVENAQQTTDATQASINAPQPVNNVPSDYVPQNVQATVTTSTGNHTYTDNSAQMYRNSGNAIKNTVSQMGKNIAYNANKNYQNSQNTIKAVAEQKTNPNYSAKSTAPYTFTTTTGDHATDEVYKAAGAGLKAIATGTNADVGKAEQKESAETYSETLKQAQKKIDESNRKNAEYQDVLDHSVVLKGASDLARSYSAGISSAINGTVAGVGNVGRTAAHIAGNEDLAKKFGQFASDADDSQVQTALDNNNQFAGTVIGDLAKTTGQMLPQTILGVATGGSEAAGNIGLGLMGASVYGNESNKAFNQLGADGNLSNEDYLRANAYAGAKAATEVLTEKMDNVVPGMKMGLNQFAEEGLEEIAGGLADPFTDQILNANSLQEAGQNIAKTFTSGDFYVDLAKQGAMGSLSAIVSSSPHFLDSNYRKSLINETVTYLEHKNDKKVLSMSTHLYDAYKNGNATAEQAAVAVQNISQVCNGQDGIGGVLTPISAKYYDNNGHLNEAKFDEALAKGNLADLIDNPLKQENGDYKQTAQKANFTNIVMNLQEFAGADAKTARDFAKLSNKMETPVIFTKTPITTDSGVDVDACIKPNGVIYVNVNSQNSLQSMISHEFVHTTENSPQYAKLTSALDEMYKSGMFQDKANVLSSIDSSTSLDDAAKLRERTAVLTGSLLNNPQAIQQVADKNLPFAKYMLQTLKNWGNGDSNVTNSTINILRKAINNASAPKVEETYINDDVKAQVKPQITGLLTKLGMTAEDADVYADKLSNIYNSYSDVNDFMSGETNDTSVKSKNMSKSFDEYKKTHVGEDDTADNRTNYFSEAGFKGKDLDALVNNTEDSYSPKVKNIIGELRDSYGKTPLYGNREKELVYLLGEANGDTKGLEKPKTMRSAEFYKSYNPKESNSETVDKPVVEGNENVTNLSKYLTDNGMMKSKADKLAKMADTEYAKLQSDLNAKNGKKTNTYMNVLSEIRRSLKTNSPSTLSKDIVSILNPNVESKVEPSVETVNDVAPTVKSITPEDIKSRNTKYAVGDEISYTKQTATGANAVYGTIKKIGVDSKGRNYITINKTGETDLTGLNKEKAITGTSTINPDNASFRDSKLEDAWNSRDIKSEPIQVEEKPVTKVEPETVKEEPVKQVSKPIEKTEKEVIKEQVSKKIDTAKTDIKLSLEDAVNNLETDTKAKLKSNINPEISNIPVNTEEVSNMDNAIKKAKAESIDNVKSFVDNSKQLANMVLNNTEGLKRKKQSKLVIENLGSVIDSMKQNAEPSTPQDAITQAAEKVAQASKNSDSKIDVNAFVDGIVATEPVEKEMTRESLIEKHLKEAYEKSDGNSQITNKNLSPKTNGATELEDYHLNKTLQEASELNLPEDVKRQINKLVKSENGAVTKETYHLLENQDRMFGLIDTYGLTGAYNEVMKNFDADPETNNVSAKSITRGDITFASAVLSRCNDNSRTFTNTLVSMLKNRTDFDGKTLYQVKKYMESHNTDANITPEMKSLLKVVNTYDFMAKNIALGAGAYTNTAGVALNESKLLRESFLTMSGEMRRAKLQKDIDTMNKYIVENTSKGKKFLEQNNGSNYLDSKHKDNPSYYKDILAEYEDAVNNGDEERAEQVFEKFKSSVQKDTPYTAGEVFRSLRFYHMLANPKTHLKNIVGNTFMAAMNASKNANQMVIEQLLKNKVMHHDALNLTDADYESMAKQSGIPAEEIQNKIEEYGMNYLNRRTNAITQAIKEYNEQLTGKDNYAKRERFFKEKGFTGDTLDMLLNKKDIGTADKSGIFSLSDPNKHALSSRAEVAIQNELISQMKAGKVKYNEETGKFTFTDEKGEYKFANSAYNNAVNKYIDESELKTAKVNRAEKKMALEYVKHLQKTGYLDMGTKWEKDTANTLLQGRAALPMLSEGTGIGSKIANLTPNIINKFIDVNSNGFKSVQEGGYLAKKFNNNEAIPILSAFGLDNEDRSDFQLATSTALAMDLKNKGYTLSKAADGTWSINGKSESESLKTISKMLDSAKVVGQEAVYRDNNYLINKANEWRKTSKVGDALLDVTVPFMKTPANIVRRGIEYSPVSFAVAAAQKKKLLRGEISASDYITNISKGMAGSELAVIGAMMGMAGIISGKDDDDDYNAKQYKQSIYGYQDYSLNIGGHHFDIADFAPASSIILGGVAISDAVKAAMAGHEDNENYFKDALNMCESIASGYWNSMVDTTMLQNIQDIGKSFSESTENGDAFGKAALNVTANYVSSLFPPILKWAGQIADSKERVTYSSDAAENLKLKVLQAAGMSSSLQPKLDSKGNEITKNDYGLGAAGRAYDIFLNIAKDSKDTHTAADDKILQLYKDTGDATLLGGTQTYFTKDGTKTTLSGTDGTEYNKVYKKTLNNELGNYLISDAYAHADEDMKKTVLSGIKAYATAEAVKSYYKRTNAVDVYSAMSDSMKELDSLASKNIMSPYQYYTYKSINGIEGVSNSKGLLVRNAMETAGVYDAYIDAYKSGQISTKSLVSDSVAEMTNDEFEYEFEKITSGDYDKTAEKTDADKLSSFNTKMSKNQDVLNTAKKIGLSGDNLYSLQDVTSTKDANGKNISYSQDISARSKAVKDGSWSKIVTAVKNGTITEDEAIKLTGIGKTVFEMSDSAFNVNSTALSNGTFTGKLSGSSSKWKSSSKSSSGTSSTKSASTNSSSSTKTASSIKKSQLALYKKYVSSSNTSGSKIKTTSTSSQQALYNSIVNNHKSNIKSLKSKYKLS